LATVQSAAHNALLVTAAAGNTVWIGGTDAASEGAWVWSPSNTSLSYTNWYPGEPNNIYSGEDCLVGNWNTRWNDERCTSKFKYVCQPPDPLTMWDSYEFGLILHGPGSYYRNDPSITVNEKHVTTLDAAIARVKEVCRESPDNPVILWQLVAGSSGSSLWYHRQKFLTQRLDGSTGKPIDTGFARAVSNWKHGVRYGSPMYFRRRVFFVTRHATSGAESPGETKRGSVWGQRFDSEDEAFAKFDEYYGGSYATGVWNEQVTELKYYGVRRVAEELKEWVREEINA